MNRSLLARGTPLQPDAMPRFGGKDAGSRKVTSFDVSCLQIRHRALDAVERAAARRTGNKEHRSQEPKHISDVLTAYPHIDHRAEPDDRTPLHDLRLLADEAVVLRQGLDDRRLLERDLADLAVERRANPVGATTLPNGDEALTRLVQLTDRALWSRWLGWWYRRRLRPYGVGDRAAIETLAAQAILELRWRERRRHLAELPEAEQTWRRLVELVGNDRPARSAELLRAQIARRVAADAKLLRDRADEMAKSHSNSWTGFPELLRVLPGWAITTLSARRVPDTPALYDLVAIDEAAQCTVPAILPMLYRAKRALIIGDPRQLTPVGDLSGGEDLAEQGKAGLSHRWLTVRRLTYTGHSAYDALAAAAGATYLLDEHYRCHPDIVDVPNREVYQSRLTVLTDSTLLAAPADPAVRWRHVAGVFNRGDAGSGRNDHEIAEVVDEVHRLRSAYPDASIGVVTPLNGQGRGLDSALRAAGLSDNLLCATIHKFQGSERDIMVISPVGASGISDRTRGWLVHQTNLWNVAITRARSQLVVVGDRSWWSAQRGLLTALAIERRAIRATKDSVTAPADQLHIALRSMDLAMQRDVTLHGFTADIVVRRVDDELAVVVDDPAGDPDGRALRKLLARLDVAGRRMTVLRVPAWRCLSEPEQLAIELSEQLRGSSAAGT
jgi:hypothetical protein